jgi:hypothetical protein
VQPAIHGDERGRVELLIGLDNSPWLPENIEDSWDPDVNMRFIKF